MPRSLAIAIIVPFTILTVWAFVDDGSGGFSRAISYNLSSLQIWIDLIIAMLIWCAWVLKDAKENGRTGWPWAIAGLIFGAFSPLIYMIVLRRWPATESTVSLKEAVGTRERVFGLIMFIPFAVLTAAALRSDGPNIAATIMHSWSNFQIWVDLVIMILIWIVWLWRDARQAGRNPWGWIVLALIAGSFSPLLYMITYGRWPSSHPNSG